MKLFLVILACMCGGFVAVSSQALGQTDQVAANGAYTTSFDIAVPPAPAAPKVALVYDSVSAGGVAGVGWDLSIGWPTMIARDTRFGTPAWKLDGAWLWGTAPLVLADGNVNVTQCHQIGDCSYRLAPDNLTTVKIQLNLNPPVAEVNLPSGVKLNYEPIIYDGQNYPVAPAGAATKVLGFILSSATDTNGYKTCFQHKHFGDADRGKVAVLAAIGYGLSPSFSCKDILAPGSSSHRIDFSYGDLINDPDLKYEEAHGEGFFTSWSLRMGAPTSFSSLLKRIAVSASGTKQYEILLDYDGKKSETHRPRLVKISEQVQVGTASPERTVRVFAYGDRQAQFDNGQLIDLGPIGTFPTSVSGSVSRPIRRPCSVIPPDCGPKGVFQIGSDQVDLNAPFTNATTEQWGWLDLNGDGLLDFQWGREKGQGTNWSTFESSGTPGPRPPQQLVRISEGVLPRSLGTTPIVINSHVASMEQSFRPDAVPDNGFTHWIWAEGQGLTRTGMPVSVSAPELPNIAPGCPPMPGQDSRLWPVYPDGTLGGSQASMGDVLTTASAYLLSAIGEHLPHQILDIVTSIRDGYNPTYSIGSTLSGWVDLNGDGVPEFVTTPAWIERFKLCLGSARETTAVPNLDWETAQFPEPATGIVNTLNPNTWRGPSGPVGMPFDYQISTGSPEGFGFTLPIGSAISAGISSLTSGSLVPLALAVPGLITESFSPRSESGLYVSAPSPSITGMLQSLGEIVKNPTPGSISNFAQSFFKINYDFTLIRNQTRNRSETRSQLLDINADGLPDYVLYDSGSAIPGVPSGSLVAFLNSPEGFGEPTVINDGFDYTTNNPNINDLKAALKDASDLAEALGGLYSPCIVAGDLPSSTPDEVLLRTSTIVAACGSFGASLLKMTLTADATVAAVEAFITSTTDAIPAERFHLKEVGALRDYIRSGGVLVPLDLDLPSRADILNTAAQALNQAIQHLGRTVRQLGYRSRINAISRGFSELDGTMFGQGVILQPGVPNESDYSRGIAVQTRGFVDLNGDGLPDYVITSDREKSRDCPDANTWEVFWGSGTSSITDHRAFLPKPSCLKVPSPPQDVKTAGFITTLPLNADLVWHTMVTDDLDPHKVIKTINHSYISLIDFNHDGLPDLLIADEDATGTTVWWDADAKSRTWSIFLNKGGEFETTASLHILSPQTSQPDIQPASSFVTGLNVPYPTIRTTYTDNSLLVDRDRSDTHAALLDIDGDGTAEMVTRVKFGDAPTERDGLFVWRRSGTGPQDRLIEDRYPIDGRRILVEYKPASYFQWAYASLYGQPPKDGHWAMAGSSGQLVRSVTIEPLMGRPEQRTRVGYEYSRPYVDVEKRLPAGFALRKSGPLDPATGTPIPASVVTLQRNAQRPDGVNSLTHVRQVIRDTGAPIHETLISYVEKPTTSGPANVQQAVFAAPVRRFDIEYPEGLKAGALFDVGFDGREPLVDRAAGRNTTSASPELSPGSATGGAAVFKLNKLTPVQYPSPHLPVGTANAPVSAFTLETWLKPTGVGSERTLIEQPGAYRLLITQLAAEDRPQIEVAGTKLTATSALPSGRWAHVVATFGSGKVKFFINGVEAGDTAVAAIPTASGDLIIGCAQGVAGPDRCFEGEIGEVRIYPEAWPHAPRVTDTETELQLDFTKDDFGQPLRVLERHDLATSADDVVSEFTYAKPPAGPQRVLGAVATAAQRVLGPDGVTAGKYLSYTEHSYDGLPLGQVANGNPTQIVQFDGSAEVSTKPASLNVVNSVDYGNTACPGRPTKTVDPEGFQTLTEWDSTCSFELSKTNALGQVANNYYYGLPGSIPNPIPGFSTYRLTGRYGQLAESIDVNGAVVRYGYDEWAREAFRILPLDRQVRPTASTNSVTPVPSQRTEYSDAQCVTSAGASVPCDHPAAKELSSPSRVSKYRWDDQLDRCKTSLGDLVSCDDPNAMDMSGGGAIGDYYVTYAFSDGQVHSQTIQNGKLGWTVSGVKDYDAQGRVIRNYKVQYLPTTGTGTTEPCPGVGMWCDSVRLLGDPLRHEVAAVQTAFDARGRVIRLYGPEAPKCVGDPSLLNATGQPACDAPDALSHATRLEYPSPGVTRVTNAKGVPTVSRTDVRGLNTSTEEYLLTSTSPYATVSRTFDRLKRLIKTTDHQNNVSTSTYDALGRVVETNDPDMGEATFAYNLRGLLKERILANGDIARHTYDPLSRLTYSEYRRSQLGKGNDEQEIDPCRAPCDPSRFIDRGDIFKRFQPVPPRAPLSGVQWTALSPDTGNLDGGVAALRLPFDVTLTPNALWTVSDDTRRQVKTIPGTNSFPAGTPIFINTNGKIRFDSGGAEDVKAAEGTSLPTRTPEVALYPYYSDLMLEDGGLRSTLVGRAPNRELVIEWSGTLRAAPREAVKFRAIISEADSEVRYEYDTVPARVPAIVGATNHSLQTPKAVVVRAVGEAGERFVPATGTAVSSNQKLAEKRFVLRPLLNENAPKANQIEFTVPLGQQGPFSLSFRHRWFSRCALVAIDACQVDRMQVGYRDPTDPSRIIVLIPPDRLISNVSLDSADHDKADEILKVALPDSLAGRDVPLIFQYDPVIEIPIREVPFKEVKWNIDHIQVQGVAGQSVTRIESPIEEKVWREYDSAESSFELASAGVLVDFTFDVPGRIEDRAGNAHPVRRLPPLKPPITQNASISSVTGVSGNGIRVPAGVELQYDIKTNLIGPITAEAWVRPEKYPGAAQVLLKRDGIFQLQLLPDGYLGCEITAGGTTFTDNGRTALPTDAWSHVALTYDGTTLRCYVNGITDSQLPASGLPGAGPHLLIGDGASTVQVDFDEVRLFYGALTYAQVLEHALRPLRAGPPRGNLIDIRFSNPLPLSAGQDSSKAGNNATVTGGLIVPGIQGSAFQMKAHKRSLPPIPDGEITIPHNNTLEIPEAVTVELWLKTISHAKGPAQLIQKWSGSGPGWQLALESFTGQLRWDVMTSSSGPINPRAIFVTYETVNDDQWHHVAATYDGTRLRVYIDGVPAHRTCSPTEPLPNAATQCIDFPVPDKCAIEAATVQDAPGRNQSLGDAFCAEGRIANNEPVLAGRGFDGAIDELRVSNYAKREFEIAASSQLASAYTQVLGREVDLRNELPVGTQVAREVRAYNLRGEIASTWKRVTGQTAPEDFLARYAVDTLGRPGSRENPDGEVAVSRFDHTALQTGLTGYGPSIAANGGSQHYMSAASATVTGLVENIAYGNEVTTSYSYDDGPTIDANGASNSNGAFGRDSLKGQTISSPKLDPTTGNRITLSQRAYVWNEVNNLESVNDTAEKYSATYTYDDLNRVKTATFQVTSPVLGRGGLPLNLSRSYDYDSNGNLTVKDGVKQDYGRANSLVVCGTRTTAIPHAITRRTIGAAVNPYCYDEIGRISVTVDTANSTSRNHNYYARGTLSKLTDVNGEHDFRYDGNGTRVAKKDPATSTIEPYGFYRELSSGTESLYSANGQLVTRRTGSQPTDVFWYHSDHLGSTNLMTDANGGENVSARSHYFPFGEFITEPTTNHSGGRQFTGKELDEIGYYDYGSRYYDPAIGRFAQPDSIIPNTSPQAYNAYSYSFNNPLRFIDPSGHAPMEPSVQGSAAQEFGAQSVPSIDPEVQAKLDRYRAEGLLGRRQTGWEGIVPDPRLTTLITQGENYQTAMSAKSLGQFVHYETMAVLGLFAAAELAPTLFSWETGLLRPFGNNAGLIAQRGALALRRFIFDPRTFETISAEYWKVGTGAAGRALHHWLIPRFAITAAERYLPTWGATFVRGIGNSGLNLLEVPGWLNTVTGGGGTVISAYLVPKLLFNVYETAHEWFKPSLLGADVPSTSQPSLVGGRWSAGLLNNTDGVAR
jgi:RHS repeat-associated protein